MTVETASDAPSTTVESSSKNLARHHLAASLGFLVLGVFVLALASLQFVAPDLLGGSALVSYGRLHPLAIHLLVYGWVTLGLLGAVYYAVPRLVDAPLASPRVAGAGFILMSLGYALGGLGIWLGQSEGVRYLEAPPWADFIVLLGLLAAAHSISRTVARGASTRRSPATWFMLAAVLWLVALHVIGNLSMVSALVTAFGAPPVVLHGINGTIVAGFYRAGLMGLWAATAGVGVVYFLVPRLVGLEHFRPTRMSVVGFWGLGLAWAFTGTAELTFTAVPNWLETIGVMFSMALLLPVATIIVDIVTVVRDRRDQVTDRMTLGLVLTGLGLFGAIPVLNLLEALRASSGIIGFTDWVNGVELLAVLGAFSFWLFAYVYHVLPAMVGAGAVRVRRWHVRLTILGLALAVFAMLVGGIITGFTWAAGGESGELTSVGLGFATTADAVNSIWLPWFRAIGLFIFAFAQVAFLTYATMAWWQAPVRSAVLGSDPEFAEESQEVDEELEVAAGRVPDWRRIFTGAVAIFALAYLLVVLLPAQETDAADPTILADSSRSYVAGSATTVGRDLYINQGCAVCHSQVVRPVVADIGLGPVSVAGDYAHEVPVLVGYARMGPDLMHAGARDAASVEHLVNPRAERPWSTMPSYNYLSDEDLTALVAYVNGLK